MLDQLKLTLGDSIAPNHVGHLYDAVIDTLREVKDEGIASIEFYAWFEDLEAIKSQGEVGHFELFQSVYQADHPLLQDAPEVWSLPASDARYPCYQVPLNATAYSGHANSIEDPELRALAWLGNLNYWCMLSLLDTGYRSNSQLELALAQTVMMGPLMSLAQQLPAKGSAVPFDPLSMGFEPGFGAVSERRTAAYLDARPDIDQDRVYLFASSLAIGERSFRFAMERVANGQLQPVRPFAKIRGPVNRNKRITQKNGNTASTRKPSKGNSVGHSRTNPLKNTIAKPSTVTMPVLTKTLVDHFRVLHVSGWDNRFIIRAKPKSPRKPATISPIARTDENNTWTSPPWDRPSIKFPMLIGITKSTPSNQIALRGPRQITI